MSNWDHFLSRSPRSWLLKVVSGDRQIEDQRNAYKAGGLKYSYMQAWVSLFMSIEAQETFLTWSFRAKFFSYTGHLKKAVVSANLFWKYRIFYVSFSLQHWSVPLARGASKSIAGCCLLSGHYELIQISRTNIIYQI